MQIGIIGCGNMGGGMANTLTQKGKKLLCFDSSLDTLEKMKKIGCKVTNSPNNLIQKCDLVILSLPTAKIVRDLMEVVSPDIKPGTIIVDTSTSEPDTTKALSEIAKQAHYHFIDGPVSGGPVAANSGSMTMLLGGDKNIIESIQPTLDLITLKTVIVGPSGAGHAAKIANNMLCAANLVLVSEVVKLGNACGISPKDLLNGINAGSGRSGVSEVNFPKWVLNEDYNSGFTMGLMRKDVKLGLELTNKYGVTTPTFDIVASIWEESNDTLPDNKDFNEIYKMSKKND